MNTPFAEARVDIEGPGAQAVVNAYFRQEACYWADIYEQRNDIAGAIHQERLRATLAMVDRLGLPTTASALDVGCGAGLVTVGLACRGFTVAALDPVQVMVNATRKRAIEAGVDSRVRTQIGCIDALPYPDEAFDLIVALGVLPWLPEIQKPLLEMTRVLRPGAHMIVTIDTLWQLRQILDPLTNPLLGGARKLAAPVARTLGWRPRPGIRSYVKSIRSFRRVLGSEGLEALDGVALGFGPFTVFGRDVLPRSVGLMLNNWLQSKANRRTPFLRSSGSQYLVLAKKCIAGSKD